MAESRRVYCCRGFLAALAFLLWVPVYPYLGRTLGNLQLLTKTTSSLSSAASVISANALGAIIGILMCAGCNTFLNTFCVILFALPLCSITTLVVPWCTTLASVSMVVMLQGAAMGIIEQCCYSVFYAYWRRRHSMLTLFYITFALGATISPLLASSFFVMNPQNVSINGVNLANETSSSSVRLARDFGSVVGEVANSSDQLCNETMGNCTSNLKSNLSSSSISSTTSKPKKPVINEATHLDPKESKTEHKVLQQTQIAAAANARVGNGTTNVTAPTGSTSMNSVTTMDPTTSTTVVTSTSTSTSTSTVTSFPSTVPTVSSTETLTSTSISESTTANPRIISDETWERMKSEFFSMDGYQLTYVVVGSISIILTVLYAFVCCFTPCHRQGIAAATMSSSSDRFHFDKLWRSRNNFYAIWTSVTFAFLLVGLESILSSLLTVYAVITNMARLHSAIAATSTFWFCVCLGRIIAASSHSRLLQTIPTAVCLGIALLAMGIAVVFNYWTILWLVTSILGCCYGCLYPLMYCWLDQQLMPGPWFTTAWCLAGQIARLLFPVMVSAMMERHAPKDFLFALLMVTMAACVIYIFMRSTVREAARLVNVEQQQRISCKINFGGGDSLFEYHHFNDNEWNVEKEADDEITYFDRSRSATANGTGSAPLFELNSRRYPDRH